MEPGSRLPPEKDLCREYNVSRVTIRRAVEDLVLDGLISRLQGSGTFVEEPRYVHQVRETFADRVTGFYRQQEALGREVTSRVLANRVVRDADAAQSLGLNAAEDLIYLERLRFVNGQVYQHVVTYLAAERFSRVLGHDFSTGSLFDFLSETYGVKLVRNDILVRIEKVKGRIAGYLHVDDGSAALVIDSTVFESDGNPVAFGRACLGPNDSEIGFSVRQDV